VLRTVLKQKIGVAYATPLGDRAVLNDITVVKNWGHGAENMEKIPSVISYQGSRYQWGANIDLEADVMVHTKLELDTMSVFEELEATLTAMKGMRDLNFVYVKQSDGLPDYTWKTTETIVTDYLTKIFEYLQNAISSFSATLISQLAVDIVVTVPVVRLLTDLLNLFSQMQ
jgi:hypothetical protein